MIDINSLKYSLIDLAVSGKISSSFSAEDSVDAIIQSLPPVSNKRKKLLDQNFDYGKQFEIPGNWKWVRLGEISSYGDTPNKVNASDVSDNTWILDLEDIKAGGELLLKTRVKEKHFIGEKTSFKSGQVLYSKLRPYLKKILVADEDGISTPELIAFDTYGGIIPQYIVYCLLDSFTNRAIDKRSYGIKMPRIDAGFMANLPIPIPPVSEQEYIVDRLEGAFSLIDKIDALQKQYASNQETLKVKLIDAAIQGELTEQLPEDGTAEDLRVEAIKYKDELDRQGVLKNRKNKDVRAITEEDCIFDLPASWAWFRLGEIIEVFGRIGFRGYKKTDLVQKGQGAITMSPSNISRRGEISFEDSTYISWEKYEESPEIMLEEGDVVLVKTGSTYGKSGIIKKLPEKATINPQLAILKYIKCNREYLAYVLQSTMAWTQYQSFVVGAATPTFSQEKIANMMIPMPPMAEQKRIVDSLDTIMGVIKKQETA